VVVRLSRALESLSQAVGARLDAPCGKSEKQSAVNLCISGAIALCLGRSRAPYSSSFTKELIFMEKIPQKPKPKVMTFEERINRNIEQGKAEIGKRESQPKTQQTATQGQQTASSPNIAELKQKLADLKAQTPSQQQQQTQLSPSQQKLVALKQSVPQKSQSTPTAKPPSASL
jgi:hypothetical protein